MHDALGVRFRVSDDRIRHDALPGFTLGLESLFES